MNKNVYRRNNTFPLANGGGIPYFQNQHGDPNQDQTDCFISRFDLTAVEAALSTKEHTVNAPVFVYPNPTEGNVYISMPDDKNENVSISVYGMQGRLLMRKRFENTSSVIHINLSNFPAGMYFIQLVSQNDSHTTKIIKK